jgi:hypothetical protein
MLNEGSLVPITDEQAKALQEALKTLRGLGDFVEKALGSVPEDLVGLLGGDWLKVRRTENMAGMMRRAKERLTARGIKEPQPAALTIALPILRAAADEDRQELQDLWARLLAAAMDPSRRDRVRLELIEVVKKMAPIDASVIQKLSESPNYTPNPRDALAGLFALTPDEIELSFANLIALGCIIQTGGIQQALTAKGRVLMSAVRD